MKARFISFSACAAALMLPLISIIAQVADAASISYGNFGPLPPGITFTDVEESSDTDPVPLFGSPAAFAIGLDTDPTNFVATSDGGTSDSTDGQFSSIIVGNVSLPNFVSISSIKLAELGDYTLAGTGTAATQALAEASVQVTVTQLNGVDVAPIVLNPSSASVALNLLANAGVVQPWSLSVTVDVDAQLASLGFGPDQLATAVELVVDNQLDSLSELASVAFIAKKDFTISIEAQLIPEPCSQPLMLIGLLILSAARRRHYFSA
jgi:hypothetical protein